VRLVRPEDKRSLRLIEKLSYQTPLFLVFDTREEFGAEASDGLGLIEWHFVVDLTALEMTWLAASLEDRFYLSSKIRLRRRGK
jgi:hypothetical protein